MNDFDFLKDHGFGVVYGEKNVRKLINQLGHTDPRKGNDMNANVDIALETIDELPLNGEAVTAPIAVDPVTGDETRTVFVQDEAYSEDEVR